MRFAVLLISSAMLSADENLQAGTFGLMHPLFVHIPIGMFVGVLALECYRLVNRRHDMQPAISFLWVLVTLSTIVTIFSGLSLPEDDYNSLLLDRHQLAGFAFFFSVLGVTILRCKKRRNKWQQYGLGLCIASCLVTIFITGHYGGTMTHGTKLIDSITGPAASQQHVHNDQIEIGFGLEQSPTTLSPTTNSKNPAITDSAEKVLASWTKEEAQNYFDQHIHPVFMTSCIECHGPKKEKGGLRLDSLTMMMRGGDSGQAVLPGQSKVSLLYELIILDAEHPDVMPPKGDLLNQEQINLIAEFIDRLPLATAPDSAPQKAAQAIASDMDLLAHTLPAIPEQELLQLRILGMIIEHLDDEQRTMSINLRPLPPHHLRSAINKLQPWQNHIIHLDYRGQQLHQQDLSFFSGLSQVQSLNFAGTNISDHMLQKIDVLPQLESINLYQTKISNVGLMALSKHPTLSRIYCWQSRVNEAGKKRFLQQRPQVKISIH